MTCSLSAIELWSFISRSERTIAMQSVQETLDVTQETVRDDSWIIETARQGALDAKKNQATQRWSFGDKIDRFFSDRDGLTTKEATEFVEWWNEAPHWIQDIILKEPRPNYMPRTYTHENRTYHLLHEQSHPRLDIE